MINKVVNIFVDRVRNSGSSFKSKQRNSYGNNSKHLTNNSSQLRNGKQLNISQKQPRPKSDFKGKAKKVYISK